MKKGSCCTMLKVLLMSAALSLDCLAAGIGLASEKIKLPPVSAVIISFVGTLFLSVSLFFSDIIEKCFDREICRQISFWALFILGIICILGHFIKRILKKCSGKNLCIKCRGIRFAVSLYIDETAADCDRSKSISPLEATALAAALSTDSLLSGISAGLTEIRTVPLLISAFIFGLFFLLIGSLLGRMTDKREINISWISGAILILLAFL